MLDKEKVLKMVDGMPDRFTLDELVENLILLEKRKSVCAKRSKER